MKLHLLGVLCGLAAGVWLGAAEAPTKLVDAGFSPFVISLCMVAGVFTARWTFPTLMKGTGFVFSDIAAKPHLIVWAVLAGALWAVANTLTVFAIRDVGLAVAFPLWNANSLIGLVWGILLFGELKGASPANTIKVVTGGFCIVAAAILLGFSTLQNADASGANHATRGLMAAAGASLMWGTMYVPYRKAYLSGMNPLSFVTIFTFGEIGTMLFLGSVLPGSLPSLGRQLLAMRPSVLWLLLGGFCWVIGDLFQQYATKYVGISRAIPLSNTNQLWGFAWGVLVFGELSHLRGSTRLLALAASGVMIIGAMLIAGATVSAEESDAALKAVRRECDRYDLEFHSTLRAQSGVEHGAEAGGPRRWWDYLIVAAALAI